MSMPHTVQEDIMMPRHHLMLAKHSGHGGISKAVDTKQETVKAESNRKWEEVNNIMMPRSLA